MAYELLGSVSNESKTNPIENQVEITEEPDYILSLCWFSGKLGAVYYNLETCELSIVYEIVDLRPDLTYLQNLLRQLCPAFILYSGSVVFNTDFTKILELPDEMNQKQIRKKKGQPPNRSNIVMSVYDSKDVSKARVRVMKIRLPGLEENATDTERTIFFKSILPFDQDLVLQSLANLLEYVELHLNSYWNMNSLIVSDLLICRLENQLLMDSSSFYGLNIFTTIEGRGNHNDFNLFNLLNQCSSYSGSVELRKIMLQPIRDPDELNLRFSTVEWCCRSENVNFLQNLRTHLRTLKNLPVLYKKMVGSLGNPTDIKAFKRCVYHTFLISEEAGRLEKDHIKNTMLENLVDAVSDDKAIRHILFSIDRIVDLETSIQENRFCVRPGVDPALDEKRELMYKIKDEVYNDTLDVAELQLPGFAEDYYIAFMPGIGFLIAIELADSTVPVSLNTTGGIPINIVYQKDNVIYFTTSYCEEMTKAHSELDGKITFMQLKIFDRLVRFINESLPELVTINKVCARIDVMISFASVSMQRNYNRPTMTSEKILQVINGRHPLVEGRCEFIANTTDVSVENKNLITIITAPNASGKSVYMKQVGLICYMAHIGCFVPADKATICLFDTIYTRIYTMETVTSGESSHLADLRQMSRVVNFSTSQSLTLIDEFGKGTDEKTAQCLLTACIQYLAEHKAEAPITIITTHYTNILKMITDTEFIVLKTIRTRMEEHGYVPMFKLIDGFDEVPWFVGPEEMTDLLDRMMNKNPTFGERDMKTIYNLTMDASLAIACETIRMVKETGDFDEDLIAEMFYNMDLNDILECSKENFTK